MSEDRTLHLRWPDSQRWRFPDVDKAEAFRASVDMRMPSNNVAWHGPLVVELRDPPSQVTTFLRGLRAARE